VLRYFSPSYKGTDNGKTETRDEMIKEMKQNFAMAKTIQVLTLKVDGIQVKGSKATGVEHMHMVAMITNPNDAKKTSKLEVDQTSDDTFIKENSMWKFLASTTTKSVMKIDGKEIKAGG